MKNEPICDLSIACFKHKVKDSLLKVQNAFDDFEWYAHLNSNIESLNRL